MKPKTLGATVVLSRSLSRTAISKEMNVNGKLLQSLIGVQGAAGNSFNLRIQYKSRDYKVNCRSRKKGGYKKWVLSGRGWLDLIRQNKNLKAGHRVTIFKPDGAAGTSHRDLFVMEDGADIVPGAKVRKRGTRKVSDHEYSVLLAAEVLLDLKLAPPAHVPDLNTFPGATRMIDLNSPPSPSNQFST